jgi:hypothetical protein
MGITRPSPRAVYTGELDPRDLKTALLCISFLRKGEVLAYVGRNQNLKDLKGTFVSLHMPVFKDHRLAARREPSALYH